MAKQTFTTGQVLTAAQMTSLQQTAMGGGSTTAKTTSYTLVAADAGTVVQMNSASATTITVNTALFAAGDTVQIQNIGAGVCTVTAGTATVNTSATLALSQYDAGTLYFNTTSAAFFFNTDAADGGGGMTAISTGTLSGSGVTFSSIAGTYNNLELHITGYNLAGGGRLYVRVNSDTGSNYVGGYTRFRDGTASSAAGAASPGATAQIETDGGTTPDSGATNSVILNFPAYKTTTGAKVISALAYDLSTYKIPSLQFYGYTGTAGAITSITIVPSASTFSAGTYTLYGVK